MSLPLELAVDCPRRITEYWEEQMLAPQAQRSAHSRGRMRATMPCPYRTEYQRDRDRILHSKAFRRLAAKTQVFVMPRTDHTRTRLTHSLEVCQVARTIARALRLNEDLAEAIALGHDMGHSPYGHSGETALDAIYRAYDPTARFHHAEQGLRVVDLLERDGEGLNLTWEVRDGILRHSKGSADWENREPISATLEGQLVALCDRIAYSSHDIDDALGAGLLTIDALPTNIVEKLGFTHSDRLTAMVTDVVHASQALTMICMTPAMTEITNQLKNFMYENVYLSGSIAPDKRDRISEIITTLFHYCMDHPEDMPGAQPPHSVTERARIVCDYISGMTDHFAENEFNRITGGA